MSIIETSVRKPVAMSMFLLIVMAMGIFASIRIPVDFLPDIENPAITVSTSYTGAGPEEVETSITRPLENSLATVENIKEITSVTTEGNSSIRLEFEWGSDLDQAMFDIRENIDIVEDQLPDNADSPRIFKFSTDMIPVMGVSISGIGDPATAYDIADNQIRKALEQVPGVAQVTVSGGRQTEVLIELTQERLQAYNLDPESIAQTIGINDVSSSGGYVYQGSYKFGIRTDAEIRNLEDFRNIVLDYRNGVPIFLKDVASVSYGGNEDNPLFFVTSTTIEDESPTQAGSGAVALEITKSSGANTVEVERLVKARLESLKDTLPPSVEITEIYNTAEDIRQSLASVQGAAIQGGLFALLVIFFYLWNWRALLVIGLAIPTSIITTFIAMYAADVSFNTISMAGLTLAIGMMVDSAIVVLENIFRHRSEGMGKYDSSIKGAQEVGLSITASTFTTIAVFIPILFVEGLMGQLFRDLVVTVVVGLLASLIISITLVPMLCSILIKKVSMEAFDSNGEIMTDPYLLSKLSFNERVLHVVDINYKKLLDWSVSHKKLLILGSNGIVLVLMILFGALLPKEYMPVSDDGQLSINLTFPLGTRVAYNEQISRQILGELRDALGETLELATLEVKGRRGFFGAVQEHTASMRISLVPRVERSKSVDQLVDEFVRPILAKYPVKNNVRTGGGFGGRQGGEAIEVEIQGNDLDVINKLSEQYIDIISGIDGIENPRNTDDGGVPEVSLRPDRVALARSGLSPTALFSTISTAFGGRVATTVLGRTGNDIDARVQVKEEDRDSLDSLLNVNVKTPQGSVPFRSLVEVTRQEGPSEIKRADSTRIVEIRAGTSGQYAQNLTGAVDKIREVVAEKLFIPAGVNILYKGDFEETQSSMLALLGAFFLSIFVVYALMAAQFESYVAPFIIMLSVPFGALGSMALLFFVGHSLNIYSMVGVVILVGIVINNGIVLIDYMNQLLEKGVTPDAAALQAGIRRIRPVCMTTFTTILGMFPMALGLGEGGDTYAPLAVSVIGGLVLSTFFTLLVVPTAYAAIRKRLPYATRQD